MNARNMVFQYHDPNANAAQLHRKDYITVTKASIKQMMIKQQPEIDTLDDLAQWCAMPEDELQNHIA